MKVKELIALLWEEGRNDLEANIYISADAEGNYFGSLEEDSLTIDKVDNNNVVLLYPHEEHLDFYDLK